MSAQANSNAAPARQAPKVERIGPYILLDRLGRGGMAEVFTARLERDGDFKKLVAIKRMLPDLYGEMAFAQRFLDEARTVANLNHPNLVQVFDTGTQDGRPYLVMELVDGTDLWRLINMSGAQGKQIPIDAAIYIAAEVARGLGYVHAFQYQGQRLNIVHRDVSPQNLILGRNGEVKVLDFGIAKANSEVFQRSAHTQHNAVLGKMRYMSPEQLEGLDLDGRTDLYALGVVLHEMLTAKRLIDAKSPGSIVRQVREAIFDPPSKNNPEVSPELDAIVLKMLAREASDRYPDGNVLAKELYTHLAKISPGYGRADLGELIESRLPKKPPAETSSAAQEVSLASILEAEVIGTPPNGQAGASPLELVPGPNDPAHSGLYEFDEGLASRLEPRPTSVGEQPAPAEPSKSESKSEPTATPSLNLSALTPEPSIQIIRGGSSPTGALPMLAPVQTETRITLPEDVLSSVLEQHLAAENTQARASQLEIYDDLAPELEPEKKPTKANKWVRFAAGTAVIWGGALAVALFVTHTRPAPVVVAPVIEQHVPDRAPAPAPVAVAAPAPVAVPAAPTPVMQPPAAVEPTKNTSTQKDERTARVAPPQQARARYLDGKVVVSLGQASPPGAEEAVARAKAAYEQARTALVSGRNSAAAAGFERALSEYPGFVAAYRGLASAYLADGQTDLALNALDTSARFAADGERSRLHQAIALLQRGEEASLPLPPAP